MPASRLAALVRLSLALVLALFPGAGRAAELGDPVVLSYIGQPLVADIELTTVADPAQAVGVHLSSPDVYREANIGMHPVLASVNMSVMRRDGRQFLHLTSVKPVDSDHVLVFVDLLDGGKRNVRSATLWLSPDPNPAPPPLAIKPPAPVPDAPLRASKPEAIVLRQPVRTAPDPQSAEQNKACAAADYKNGLLSAQIVELEEKVKALQLAIDKRDAPAAAKPAPKKAIPTPALAPAKPATKAEGSFPWLWVIVIVAVMAALGGGVAFYLSRRKTEAADTAAADSVAWYTTLASRFRRKPKAILIPEDGAGDA